MIRAVHYPPFQFFKVRNKLTRDIEYIVASKCEISDTEYIYYDENGVIIRQDSVEKFNIEYMKSYSVGIHELYTDTDVPPCANPVITEPNDFQHEYVTIKEMNEHPRTRWG